MHTDYIQEMELVVKAIIKKHSLGELFKDRTHIINVVRETKNLDILNDIFDTFVKDEETIDIGIYLAIKDNKHIDNHIKDEIDACHAKLIQPTLEEFDKMQK